MRIERRSGTEERLILTGMIVDPIVLGRVATKWDKEGLFASKWCNIVGRWCVQFLDRYGKPPGKAIEGLFESWATRHTRDKETADSLQKFLSSLSEEYASRKRESNSDYVIDVASKHFNKVSKQRLKDQMEGLMDEGKLDDVDKLLANHNKIEMGGRDGIDILMDKEAVIEAFKDKEEPLITYPGPIGRFLGDAFERDSLIAIEGPEKRGKTWMLMDFAWMAMLQRRKVAFFEVGDLSQNQIMRRFMIRAAHSPLKASTLKIPTAIERNGTQFAEVTHKEKVYDKGLSPGRAWEACERVMHKKVKSKNSLFKLFVRPNDTITVHGVRDILRGLERQAWIPDVIVIDYADILAPLAGAADTRDQINKTWKALKSMSQSLHCLVITATQTDAASYNTDLITRKNFSEDKRKMAHVNGMLAINCTDEEKEQGMLRMNWIQLRESEFSERRCIYVAGCLGLASPIMKTCL